MKGILANHATAALDWLWPPVCPRCGERAAEPRSHFCESCWSSLEPLPPAHGPSPIEPAPGSLVPVFAAFVVNTLFLDMLATSKYRRYRNVGRRLAREAARVLRPRLLPSKAAGGRLVPVPIAPVKRRERGFNQTEDFALALAGEPLAPEPPPFDAALLVRSRGGRALAGQARDRRAAAISGAFAAGRADVSDAGRLLLVDDVITTGATLAECARELVAAGGDVAGCVVMGRAIPGEDAPPTDRSLLGRL